MIIELFIIFLLLSVIGLFFLRRKRNEIMGRLLGIDLLNVAIDDIARMIKEVSGGKAFILFSKERGGIKLAKFDGSGSPDFLPVEMDFLGGIRPISPEEKSFMKKSRFVRADTFRLKFGETDYLIKIYFLSHIYLNRINRPVIADSLKVIQSALQIRALSKQRMKETQIINDLNLRIAALMDRERILTALVNSSRDLLLTDKIILVVAEDGILRFSPIKEIAIRDLPIGLYNQLFLRRTSMAISDLDEFPK